ncbi:hypothetical protein BZA05DRAFT_415710 [Tricharina praecox]|uniref:uncharacterized protein n=1 Tax=Tricharina praecox TaxID=43433 RepID=UPI00221F9ABE|nr:uncharacterized protein BZA05DRAFT_415710 [Tricharina praecox]KAI5857001.1 hypothetical protein BZA05DRAFT_415710 [Tricharina praecox]
MAALVQTYPAQQQSSAPVSLMQPRSQASHGASQGPGQHNGNASRYNNSNNGGSYRVYSAPVSPYAFTSTPGLTSFKAPSPSKPAMGGRPDDTRQAYTSLDSLSSDANLRVPSQSSPRSTDDSSLNQGSRQNVRPLSTTIQAIPPAAPSPTREKPDRYKRVNRNSQLGLPAGSAQPSGSGVAAVYQHPSRANSSPSLPNSNGAANLGQGVVKAPFVGDYTGQLRSQSVDDIHTYQRPSTYQTTQSRRRSVGPGSMTAENFQSFLRQELASTNPIGAVAPDTSTGSKNTVVGDFKPPMRPGSRRTGSTDSSASGSSSRASSNRNSIVSNGSNTAQSPVQTTVAPTHEYNVVNIPPRGSSADVSKRTTAPSPLSRSAVGPESNAAGKKPMTPVAAETEERGKNSSAVEHLNALNDGPKKGMKNRLRRAFSFGSAAELRKASAVNSMRGEEAAERARARQDRFREEQDIEQARIARRQEAAGLGENIYNGQGNFFTGSTDNISVSSTASSASIMIRKMGKGIKRQSRSLVGLFRPKSVTGVEPASGPVSAQPSPGQVSMITVEAEREKVNVNVNAADQVGGGTGFPKLERNSLEVNSRVGTANSEGRRGSASGSSHRRRSVVGGETEVTASVKGILKRAGSSSPVTKPTDTLPSGFQLPEIPIVSGPENQRPGSNKSQSVKDKNEQEDYFMAPPRLNVNSHSAPASPSSGSKFNVSFSPRITFHDTWPSGEYDRRGEIATCNRLTPLLAQQIKEELNTFKMEMDVHEDSKVYTHFF